MEKQKPVKKWKIIAQNEILDYVSSRSNFRLIISNNIAYVKPSKFTLLNSNIQNKQEEWKEKGINVLILHYITTWKKAS